MAMINISRYSSCFNFYDSMDRVRVGSVSHINKLFIVVAYDSVEPVFSGEKIKNPVKPCPFFPYQIK